MIKNIESHGGRGGAAGPLQRMIWPMRQWRAEEMNNTEQPMSGSHQQDVLIRQELPWTACDNV